MPLSGYLFLFTPKQFILWEEINLDCAFIVNTYSCAIFRIVFISMSVSVIIYKIEDKVDAKDSYKN